MGVLIDYWAMTVGMLGKHIFNAGKLSLPCLGTAYQARGKLGTPWCCNFPEYRLALRWATYAILSSGKKVSLVTLADVPSMQTA